MISGSSSALQLPANTDARREWGWLKDSNCCHTCERPGLSSQILPLTGPVPTVGGIGGGEKVDGSFVSLTDKLENIRSPIILSLTTIY